MAIESNFLNKMSITNQDNVESMDFVLSLDLLNGCVHSCDGCFVRKNNDQVDVEALLEKAVEIASGLSGKGLRFRELILAPTDFFSAKNTKELLLNPLFQKLLRFNDKTRITASCIFDSMDKENFLELFNILDNTDYFREEMILEFLIPLHSEKTLAKEAQYMTDNKWALDFFKNKTPKVIDWSYVINISNNEVLKNNYKTVVSTIKEEFGTILEFNPGFFRTNNKELVDGKLSYWKQFIQKILEGSKTTDFCLTNLDKFHNSSNTICLNLIQKNVFVSPFIYEQIVSYQEVFKVYDLSAESIMEQHRNLQVQGFNYANKTDDCLDCEYLTSCVGRNVLNYMEVNEKKSCLFPEEFKSIN